MAVFLFPVNEGSIACACLVLQVSFFFSLFFRLLFRLFSFAAFFSPLKFAASFSLSFSPPLLLLLLLLSCEGLNHRLSVLLRLLFFVVDWVLGGFW